MVSRQDSRFLLAVVASLACTACSTSGGASGFNNSQGMQQTDAVVPQTGGAQRMQTVGAQAMNLEAPAPPQIALPELIKTASVPVITKPVIDDIDSLAGGPIIAAENTGSNGVGVEGIITTSGEGVMGVTQGAGEAVYGNGGKNGGIGVYGYSVGNYGVIGNSVNFTGILGETSANNQFGGYFKNTSSTGPGTALMATSAAGTAVEGSSNNGPGVFGLSPNGIGILGTTTSGFAGEFLAQTNLALYANSGSGVAIYGSTSSGGSTVEAFNSGPGTALYAGANTGQALHATSAGLSAYIKSSNGNGADIQGNYIGVVARGPTTGFPLVATDASGNDLFYVDGKGNVFYHGTIGTFAAARNGLAATAYGTNAASPSVEDTGSARLRNGSATVPLDPVFAQTIDPQRPYHVLLTPDGDTRGLFVASKGRGAFVVREVQGGHGSFDFDYHIYATPLGRANVRMTFAPHAALVSPNVMPEIRPALKPPPFIR
jgi:hypothetical protein